MSLNHQLPRYMTCRPNPGSCAVDPPHQLWRNLYRYGFLPFCLIKNALTKIRTDQSLLLVITPAWKTQLRFATLISMSVEDPIIVPNDKRLFSGPQG